MKTKKSNFIKFFYIYIFYLKYIYENFILYLIYMPPCKNDKTRTYIGNEPSPKGNGYCAHMEKIYNIKNGRDGNDWIVLETKLGIKKWIRLIIPKLFVSKFKKLSKIVKLKKNSIWIKNYKDIDKVVIKKITLGKNGNDILVHHNGPWNIYRDINFEKAIKLITSIDFKFSEQGMQKKIK